MAFVTQNPAGGYTVTRDDGSTFLSAMAPPGINMQGGAPDAAPPPPTALNPAIPAAAAPGPDMRVAGPGGGFDLAQNVINTAGAPERNPDAPKAAALQGGTLEVPGLSVPGSVPSYLTRPAEPGKAPPAAAPQPAPAAPQQPQAMTGQDAAASLMGAGYGRPTVIKGGERKQGETYVQTTYGPEGDKHLANLKRAQQNEYEGTEGVVGAQAQANDIVGQQQEAIAKQMETYRQQAAAAEEQRQAKIVADQERLQRTITDTQREVDPGRLWANRSSSDKAMGVLAVALGALGNGLMGKGGNDVWNMYKSEIDDDIAAQKTNIDNAGKRAELMRGALADNMRVYGDQRQAELATRQQYLEQANMQTQAMLSKAKTDEDKAKGQVLLAKIQQESEKNLLDFDKVTHQVHTQVVPDRVVGGGPPAADDLNRSLVVQDLEGNKHLARDEKGAQEIRTKRALTQSAIAAAGKMRQIADKPAFDKADPTSTDASEFNMAREQFVNSMNSLAGQGVVRGEDIERYQKEILGGKYGLATAKAAEKFAGLASQGFKNIYSANADTETRVREGAEIDPKTHRLKKGAHYDTGDLLRGAPQAGGVTFTPAGKR